MKRSPKIEIFYKPEMAYVVEGDANFSKSPVKPMLFTDYIKKSNISSDIEFNAEFKPFTDEEFKAVHSKKYVEAFFKGTKPLCDSNGLKWSPEFADSVRYTNASLYYAIRQQLCIANK